MDDRSHRSRRPSLAVAATAIVIGGIVIAIELWRGAPIQSAIGGMAIMMLYALVMVVFQRRSDTVGALAGQPVDERWVQINQQALAVAATAAALASLIGFAVMEAQGRDNWQFALMACVVGLGYIGGMVWFRRRS